MQDKSDKDRAASRRTVVAGVATGLAAGFAAANAAGQTVKPGAAKPGTVNRGAGNQASAPSTPAGQPVLKDPVGEYPKPPFQKQHQDWPGLTSKMTPRPDHGETSYKGSGRLLGRKALITGGDSGMGRARAASAS